MDRVPHVTSGDIDWGGTVSTENEGDVRRFRSSLAAVRYIEPCAYADHKAQREFIDAADKRDVVIAAISARLGYAATGQRCDLLADAVNDAEAVLLNMPPPDGEALLWRVDRLYTPGEGIWAEGVEDQTYADLRRLLSQGRA